MHQPCYCRKRCACRKSCEAMKKLVCTRVKEGLRNPKRALQQPQIGSPEATLFLGLQSKGKEQSPEFSESWSHRRDHERAWLSSVDEPELVSRYCHRRGEKSVPKLALLLGVVSRDHSWLNGETEEQRGCRTGAVGDGKCREQSPKSQPPSTPDEIRRVQGGMAVDTPLHLQTQSRTGRWRRDGVGRVSREACDYGQGFRTADLKAFSI